MLLQYAGRCWWYAYVLQVTENNRSQAKMIHSINNHNDPTLWLSINTLHCYIYMWCTWCQHFSQVPEMFLLNSSISPYGWLFWYVIGLLKSHKLRYLRIDRIGVRNERSKKYKQKIPVRCIIHVEWKSWFLIASCICSIRLGLHITWQCMKGNGLTIHPP